MRARDVMSEGPVSIRTTAPLREAIDILESLNVRHLPVVDHDGELVGIMSDRDLRGAVPVSQLLRQTHPDAMSARLDTPVYEVMSSAVFAVRTDTNVRDVIDLMTEQRIGAVPVLDADGALVGIVSYVDLLRGLVAFAPE